MIVRPAPPAWWSWTRIVLIVGALLAFGGASFLAGWHVKGAGERQPGTAQLPEVTTTAPVPQLPSTPESFGLEAKIRQQLMERRALDGLEVQTLEVRRASASPLTLQYQFTVANSGRPYAGRMVFVIQGVLNGHSLLWLYPTDRQRNDPRFEMKVERYFQGGGSIPLPDGFQPHAVALQLHEPAGVRASRAVQLDLVPNLGNLK